MNIFRKRKYINWASMLPSNVFASIKSLKRSFSIILKVSEHLLNTNFLRPRNPIYTCYSIPQDCWYITLTSWNAVLLSSLLFEEYTYILHVFLYHIRFEAFASILWSFQTLWNLNEILWMSSQVERSYLCNCRLKLHYAFSKKKSYFSFCFYSND